MRILIVTMFQEGKGGGTARVPFDMAKAFSKKHNVALICAGKKTSIKKESEKLSILMLSGKQKEKFSIPYLTKKNKDAIKDFTNCFSPDVIHAHEPFYLGRYMQSLALKNNIPFFYTGHILPLKPLEFSVPKTLIPLAKVLQKLFTKHYLKHFFRYCNGVVALNKASFYEHSLFLDKSRIRIISNGKELSAFRLKKKAKQKDKEKRFTFIGYISSRKNQLFLMKSLKHLENNAKLHLIGESIDHNYY
ncbi:MAG TPA: hypothetical protein ENN46_00110, partial [Candidatus Woesearchaeota archaeon]|nr:hypothetical protein [Candidatus Woesearchaeota archaeon]